LNNILKLKKKACIYTAVISVVSFFALNSLYFAARCANVRENVLRLHIIANSDSAEDQALKLAVRDRLLETGADIFYGAENIGEAAEKIEFSSSELENRAREAVKEYGFDYGVSVNLTEEYFDTRAYENFTMPAGYYRAVKVVIGEGEGRNWWCVMFPPLCLPAASGSGEPERNNGGSLHAVLTDGEANIVEQSSKYEVRFKIVEIYEKLTRRK